MAKKQVYGVFRVQKIKISNGGGLAKRLQHSLREHIAENVDKTRIKLDEKHGAQTYFQAVEKIRQLWEKADTKRSDSVGVLESLVTTTGKLPKGEEQDFIDKSVERLQKMYGENLIGYYVHRDEKETHIHAFSVPLETKQVEKKHLSADEIQKLKNRLDQEKIEFQEVPKKPGKEAEPKEWEQYKKAKKNYDKFKTQIKPILKELGFSKQETTLSCQSICGSSLALSQQQDLWHEEVFRKFGLERGNKRDRQTKDKYKNPTKVKKWAEQVEQKENVLEERIDHEAEEMVKRFKTLKKELLTGNNIESFKLDPPERGEKAQAYFKRITPDIQALFESSKIFESEYWKQQRKHEQEIQDVRDEMLQNERDKVFTLETEKGSLKRQYDALQTKFVETSSKLKNWRETTPEELREIAQQIENSKTNNYQEMIEKQNKKRQRQQGNEIEMG